MKLYRCPACGQLFALRIVNITHNLCPTILTKTLAERGVLGFATVLNNPPEWPPLQEIALETTDAEGARAAVSARARIL
jgi:hypothetical protein